MMGGGAKRAPTFLDAGAGAIEIPISGTFQLPYMGTVATLNFLVAHVVAQGAAAPAITTPAGWTLFNSSPQVALTTTLSRLFWKLATGSESGNLDITATADIRISGRMYRFSRGSGVEAAAAVEEAASDTSQPVVNVTTLGVNRIACQALWCQGVVTMADITGESGANYAEAVAEFSSTVTHGLQTAAVPSPTAITGGSCTLGSAVTNKISHGFAIVP